MSRGGQNPSLEITDQVLFFLASRNSDEAISTPV